MKSIKIILIFVLLCFAFFSIKSFVHSKNETSNPSFESNPQAIVINPETNIALIAVEKEDDQDDDDSKRGYVYVVDLETQGVISKVSVGREPKSIAIDRELNSAVVSNNKDNTVSVIDLNSFSVIKTISVGKGPEGVAVDQEAHIALVVNHKDDTVSVIDLQRYQVIRTIPVGKEPKDVAIDPELKLGLVVNEEREEVDDRKGNKGEKPDKEEDERYFVSIIDLTNYQVVGTVAVGKKLQTIDINPETHLAAVANEKYNSMTVIDLQTWRMTTIPVDKHPIDVAVNSLDNRVLVICDEDRSLLLIDLNTNSLIDSYSLPKKSRGVAVNNFTNIAAVINDKTDSLTLIQLSNPVPEIISVSPDRLIRGSGATKVGIGGSRFIKTSTVPGFEVDFIDNHHLEVTIPENLLFLAGARQLVVINPVPEGGSSNPASLYVNNPIPTLVNLNPESAMAGILGLTLTVNGAGFFNDTTVSVNGLPTAFTLISQTQLQIVLTEQDLEVAGYLNIRASNPFPGGGQLNTLTFTILNPVPFLSSIEPSSIIAGSPEFTLVLNGDNFVKTSIVSFNNQQFPIRYITQTQIEATIPASAITTPGTYLVKVINPTPGGGKTSPFSFTVKPPLEINIISPSDGETINKSKTIVRGIIKSDTKDIGITVNRLVAEITGSQWVVNNVPLTIGSNTITAVIKDSSGNTDTKTITAYTNEITQFVELSANVTSGIVPLQVYFSIYTSGFTPISYQMDFQGDEVTDYNGAAFDNISFTYTSEGTFYPKVTVSDNQSNTYSDTIAITVLSKVEMEILLRAKWEGMKGALLQRDISKGLESFLDSSKEVYQQAFNVIVDELPQIVSEMQDIEMIYLKENVAKYRIHRLHDIEGTLQTITYYIYFSKDSDGIWRIDRF